MFDQLAYLEHLQPWLGVFEQVPNFAVMQGGQLLHRFRTRLASLGYESFHQLLEAKDFDSFQHRRRLIVVAVRRDVHGRLGDFAFPQPVTPTRPAKTALTPLPLFHGTTLAGSLFKPLNEPLHYESGLIKLGSVAPHNRGTDVYSDQGLLPTQRTTGQGAAGATGLVMRGGVITVVTAAESQAAQQLPEDLVLTQELVGNAIPLGLVLHLGVALRDFVAPLLGTSFPTVLPTSTPTTEPSSTSVMFEPKSRQAIIVPTVPAMLVEPAVALVAKRCSLSVCKTTNSNG